MGVVTGGGGGGAAFNGGTITQPLTVDVSPASGSALFAVHSDAGPGPDPLQVRRTTGGANVVTLGTQGFNGDAKFWADWDNDNDPTLHVGNTAGEILMVALPSSDPGVSGQLYTVAGVLHVSP